MDNNLKVKYSYYVLIFSVLTLFYSHINKIATNYPKIDNPISWDVFGYYLYLPSTFIYKDIGLENKEWLDNIYKKYQPSDLPYQIHDGKNGKKVNVYPLGYSLIYSPGFFIAHLYSKIFNYNADGFSLPYQYALYISSFVFIVLGFIYFRKILLLFFNEKISAVLMLIIFFGTNYFFSAFHDPTMVHSYLFTLNCLILFHGLQWISINNNKNFYLFVIFLCLACLCRPTEIFWSLILLFGKAFNWQELKYRFTFLWSKRLLLIKGTILFTLMFSIYFIYLYYVNGTPFQLNFHSERLAFEDPYLFLYLFSFKKGWLVYTPIMIFALIGFVLMKRNKTEYFLSFSLFFIINLYLLASWECWWYGASFGQRSMVESYVLLAIPFGYVLTSIKSKILKFSTYFIIVLFILLNIFQTWQYRNGIIHSDRMTKKAYLSVFGKTNIPTNFESLLSIDISKNEKIDKEILIKNYKNIINKNIKLPFNKANEKHKIVNSKNYYSILSDKNTPFLFDFSFPLNNVNKSHIRAKIKALVFYNDSINKPEFSLVAHIESNKRMYQYSTLESKNCKLKINQWNEIEFDYLCPYIRHKSDKLKIYFWNMNGNKIYINEFKIQVFEPKFENK